MITFGLSYEQAKKIVELDAIHTWNTKVVRDVPSLRKLSPEDLLECRQEFVDDRLSEYPCDQCAYETNDPQWLNDFPKSFDIIVGVA